MLGKSDLLCHREYSNHAGMESRGSDPSLDLGTEEWTAVGTDEADKESIQMVETTEDEVEDEEDEDESDATVTDEEEDGSTKPITSHAGTYTLRTFLLTRFLNFTFQLSALSNGSRELSSVLVPSARCILVWMLQQVS